jgi:hypothetical protein
MLFNYGYFFSPGQMISNQVVFGSDALFKVENAGVVMLGRMDLD